MATTNHSEKQVDQSTQPIGFGFGTSNDSHEIEASYSWRYVDRIYVDDGTVVRSQDTDGYYNNDESFECTCGEEFACEADAKGHLREERVRGPPVPTADQPREFSWQAESETGFGGRVEYILSTTRGAGQLIDGAEYLIATARTTYTPPASYAFEDWTPLQSGRLSNHRKDPLFSERLLSRALATLSGGHQYVPDRYTLYFRGHEPLYLEGPSGGIVIAERTPRL